MSINLHIVCLWSKQNIMRLDQDHSCSAQNLADTGDIHTYIHTGLANIIVHESLKGKGGIYLKV